MTLRVARCQFPVGQGCFHATSMSLEKGTNELHYVYDCGSDALTILRRNINRYRERTASIDGIFVSHFHADHVSGLNELLGTLSVETVYIPYVSDIILLLDIIEADMTGDISGSLIEASFNPASWFGLRGVKRVVRVLPGPPDRPALGDEDEINPENGELQFVESPHASRVSPRKYAGGVLVRAELLTMDRGIIRVQSRGGTTVWALVPHVDPAPVTRLREFNRRLRATLDLRSRQKMTSDILADALRDPNKRKDLRQCYDSVIQGGSNSRQNRTSMSLYSGPMARFDGTMESCYDMFFDRRPAIHSLSPVRIYRGLSDRVGWIGTGDADLNVCRVRDDWRSAYREFESQVATLLLPHHGSWNSFHPDLLKFPNLELCVACASHPSRYMHPSERTIEAVDQKNKIFVHVSQHLESLFEERICVRY